MHIFREYLLGLDTEPYYLIPTSDRATTTNRVARLWPERWLMRRAVRDDVLVNVARRQ